MAFDHASTCECWRCEEERAGPDGLSPFRARSADPMTCEHPPDERMPISGDGWLCERCGAFVSAPSEAANRPEGGFS